MLVKRKFVNSDNIHTYWFCLGSAFREIKQKMKWKKLHEIVLYIIIQLVIV